MPSVVDEEIERPQEILSETAANVREKIGVMVDNTEIQATHGCPPHRKRIGLGERRGCLSLGRLKDHCSRRRKMQFFSEFSVDDCIGTAGIDQEVERTGSIDGDGNDNHVLTTLNLTRKGSWPMPEGRLERQKVTKARRRLERRSEGIGVHLENREHRVNPHSSACRLKSWRKPDFFLLEFSRPHSAAGNKGFLPGLWLIALWSSVLIAIIGGFLGTAGASGTTTHLLVWSFSS